jgi:hypothetical protein
MRDLFGLLQLLDQIPRQQLLDAIDRMIRDALQYVMEVPLRIDVVEFAGSCRAPDYAEPSRIGPGFSQICG